MIDKTPEQAIFDEIFKLSERLGYATYDYLPDDEVAYPFVYLGEQFQTPLENKSRCLTGTSRITLHVYGRNDDRKQVTDIGLALVEEVKRLRVANKYSVGYVTSGVTIMQDKSTGQTLLHEVIDIELDYVG